MAAALVCSAAGQGVERRGQEFTGSPPPIARSEEHQPGFPLLGQRVLAGAWWWWGVCSAEPPKPVADASAAGAAAFHPIEHNKQRGTWGDAPSARLATFPGERATPGRWGG